MEKLCIFCGERASEKSKEHILPQWLLKFTKAEKENYYFGYDFNKPEGTFFKKRVFNPLRFTFPACVLCNAKFAALEKRVSLIIKDLSVPKSSQTLKNSEINDLLDWFDKVRIGMWLAYKSLDQTFNGQEYFINSSIGKSDRALFIFSLTHNATGLAWGPIISPVFDLFPTGFYLRIGHLCFSTFSYDFYVSKHIGLLTAINYRHAHNNLVTWDGYAILSRDLDEFNRSSPFKAGTWIFQSIYPIRSALDQESILNNLKNNNILYGSDRGRIRTVPFILFEGELKAHSDGDELPIIYVDMGTVTGETVKKLENAIYKKILHWQLENYKDYHRNSPHQVEPDCIKWHTEIINKMDE